MIRICIFAFLAVTFVASAQDRPPNIVYMMSDELAYFELSHMGNPYIKTPRIARRHGLTRWQRKDCASPMRWRHLRCVRHSEGAS